MTELHLDHAIVSNGRCCALIAPDACVEWLCLPRFDSESVFASLLDRERGGHFAIRLRGATCSAAYIPDTNVLETRLVTPDAEVLVQDFCPVGFAALIRIIRPIRGTPELEIDLAPRWDYGRQSGAGPLRVHGPRGLILLDAPRVAVISESPTPLSVEAAEAERDRAMERDRAFVATLEAGSHETRSALVLHALTDAESGAMLAAATTSVPEALGEPRNWDYRYAWIRDGCFAAEALLRLGHRRTAENLLTFFEAAIGDATERVQPLFGVDGRTSLPEEPLDQLAGFGGSRPVRVGNAAALQHQHDAYGQLVWLADRLASPSSEARYTWLCKLVDSAVRLRTVPDAGIWEFRDRPGRYTMSRAWCWVAIDRGAKLAQRQGDTERSGRLATLADEERHLIVECAAASGFFAQTLDCDNPDASSLLLPTLGLVPATHPLFIETVRRCESVLAVGSMMRRYVALDDFGETTSVFNVCTLWWAEALARMGETERARDVLERFRAHGNPHGLFSEDVDPSTGALLGNIPQAYSHTGLITARLALERASSYTQAS